MPKRKRLVSEIAIQVEESQTGIVIIPYPAQQTRSLHKAINSIAWQHSKYGKMDSIDVHLIYSLLNCLLDRILAQLTAPLTNVETQVQDLLPRLSTPTVTPSTMLGLMSRNVGSALNQFQEMQRLHTVTDRKLERLELHFPIRRLQTWIQDKRPELAQDESLGLQLAVAVASIFDNVVTEIIETTAPKSRIANETSQQCTAPDMIRAIRADSELHRLLYPDLYHVLGRHLSAALAVPLGANKYLVSLVLLYY